MARWSLGTQLGAALVGAGGAALLAASVVGPGTKMIEHPSSNDMVVV